MFANQIDAPGSAEYAHAIGGAKSRPKGIDHVRERAARQASSRKKAPKAIIKRPQYRFTLAAVSVARASGAKIPMPATIRPIKAKNQPMGYLRSSISGKPKIQNDDQRR